MSRMSSRAKLGSAAFELASSRADNRGRSRMKLCALRLVAAVLCLLLAARFAAADDRFPGDRLGACRPRGRRMGGEQAGEGGAMVAAHRLDRRDGRASRSRCCRMGRHGRQDAARFRAQEPAQRTDRHSGRARRDRSFPADRRARHRRQRAVADGRGEKRHGARSPDVALGHLSRRPL